MPERLSDWISRFVESKGYVLDTFYRSGRYRVYTNSKRPELHIYIGRAGAVRIGKTIAQSKDIAQGIKARMLSEKFDRF